ncbi:MAG: cell surface receptor protein [Chloroflexi bacterium]|nr:cell surface receptor protein [Chloroflexota bacterium]
MRSKYNLQPLPYGGKAIVRKERMSMKLNLPGSHALSRIGTRLLLVLSVLLLSLSGASGRLLPELHAAATTSTRTALSGAPVTGAVLRGSAQLTLSAPTNSIDPGHHLGLTATLESFAGPLTGSVAFMEGAKILGKGVLQDKAARFSLSAPTVGIHFYVAGYQGLHGITLRTSPIAVTVGKVAARLTVRNQKLTVIGGRTAACNQVTSVSGPFQPGCEAVVSEWLPGAQTNTTLSYADGTSQSFTGTTDSKGHAQHTFAVSYMPPLDSVHGKPATIAWISVVVTSKDRSQASSTCLRFTVLAATNTPAPTPSSTSTPAATGIAVATPTATSTTAPSATSTTAPSATSTSSPSATSTAIPTTTNPQPPEATNTASPTATSTASPTATITATPTPSSTSTPTATETASQTATETASPTVTITASPTATNTAIPTPVLTSLSPTSGPAAGGTSVSITGSGFTGATSVTFGGVAAVSFTVASDTQITAVTPPGGGTVDVAITTPGGMATGPGAYTYVVAPDLTGVNPSSGLTAGGTSVTLTGMGFTGATAVTFGGIAAASFSVVSNTQITVVTPAGPAGAANVVVTTPGGSATGTGAFTYILAP